MLLWNFLLFAVTQEKVLCKFQDQILIHSHSYYEQCIYLLFATAYKKHNTEIYSLSL